MSSSLAPFRLRLTAAQIGFDPRTHYWFKAGSDDYRRLCDGASWVGRRRSLDSAHGVCWRCRGMYRDDRERGLRAFSLTHLQTGVFAPHPMATCDKEEGMMPTVMMESFAKFYAQDSDGREDIFRERDRRRQERKASKLLNPSKPTGGPPYYKHLLQHLEKYHWNTDNIDQLDRSDPILSLDAFDMNKPRNQAKLKTYSFLQAQYVATWRAYQASYLKVDPAEVWLGKELCVHVDPEIGMQPGVSDIALPWVLKLWLPPGVLNPHVIEAILYLLGEGRRISGWDGLAQLGVWNVRRADLVTFGLRGAVATSMHQAADEYLQLLTKYGQ